MPRIWPDVNDAIDAAEERRLRVAFGIFLVLFVIGLIGSIGFLLS